MSLTICLNLSLAAEVDSLGGDPSTFACCGTGAFRLPRCGSLAVNRMIQPMITLGMKDLSQVLSLKQKFRGKSKSAFMP